MKYNKEQLLKLLKLVTEISNQQGNEWFKNDLMKLLGHNRTNNSYINNDFLDAKLNMIQEYLYIDLNKLIDYNGFETTTKDQLTRDCIEMIRYHKETPNHKKNFDEFCRYAHLQIEEMLNYFYIKKCDDLNNVVIIIKDHNETYQPKTNPKTIEQIPVLTKIIAFQSLAKSAYDNSLHTTITFLNNMRNEFSHRSTLTKKKDDEEIAKFQKGFPNYKKGDIINYNTEINSREIFMKGLFIIKKREQDFSIVYKHLDAFKKVILEYLDPAKMINIKSSIGNANPILQSIKDKLERS